MRHGDQATSAQERTRPPRYAMVIPSLETGVRYWADAVHALEAEGIDVQLFTSRPPPPPTQGLPVRVVPGRFLLRTVFFVSPRLVAQLVRWRPDTIVSVEWSVATAWSILAARLLHCRVFIYQEHRTRHDLGLPRWRRLYRRSLACLADGLIANTAAARQEIVGTLRVDASRVLHIPLMSPPPREALCQQPATWGEPRARPLFLFVGRLVASKNADTLLEAAHLLRQRGRSFSAWMVGEGPERPRLEAARSRLGLEQEVRLLGSVPYNGIGWLYQACDVLVMPTYSDYRSVAVLEAMRFGKAVIDSRFDGNAGDTVRHDVNGYVFEPGDARELAGLMVKFIDDPRLIERMGRESERIIGGQTLATAMGEMARLIRASARRPAAPAP